MSSGNGGPNERPEFSCVGTNMMNTFNVTRATMGLVNYLQDWLKDSSSSTLSDNSSYKLTIFAEREMD